jgi:clan AA aspartic protease (TIGR02281 family)
MHRAAALCPALTLCLAAAGPVAAEIYRWTDGDGTVHYTQSLDQVPREHRGAARDAAARPSPSRLQTYRGAPAARAPHAAGTSAGSLRIPFRREGSLMVVDVTLNDQLTFPFYVDTGASGISLPQAAGDQLGLRVGPDTPFVHVRTANGLAARPVVMLDAVQLGGARVEGLEATLNPLMDVGLLGGSFFNNFVYHVDAAAGVIELRPNEAIRGGAGADEWRERFRRVRSPLARLEAHLESTEATRLGRRAELEARRAELRRQLEELELAANRAGVPEAWRE